MIRLIIRQNTNQTLFPNLFRYDSKDRPAKKKKTLNHNFRVYLELF